MSWGFEVGRVYNRRSDIHGHFGGQQQGGIITPADHPVVVIITGEEGLQHGYQDRYRPDGVFEYFGEGQVGPMQLQRGNRAISEIQHWAKAYYYFEKPPMACVLRAKWSTRAITLSVHSIEPAQTAMRLFLSSGPWRRSLKLLRRKGRSPVSYTHLTLPTNREV